MLNSREHDFLDSYLATLSQKERELIPHVVAEHFCASGLLSEGVLRGRD
jgi:hypothetical protein